MNHSSEDVNLKLECLALANQTITVTASPGSDPLVVAKNFYAWATGESWLTEPAGDKESFKSGDEVLSLDFITAENARLKTLNESADIQIKAMFAEIENLKGVLPPHIQDQQRKQAHADGRREGYEVGVNAKWVPKHTTSKCIICLQLPENCSCPEPHIVTFGKSQQFSIYHKGWDAGRESVLKDGLPK